ncbi:MAG: hypothetical protein AAFU85_30970, partial [Planctomycetota bacterium]
TRYVQKPIKTREITKPAGFVISLVLMGFCTYLVLRRAENRTVRDDQWKSLPPNGPGRDSENAIQNS